MTTRLLSELISEVITGEWGNEPNDSSFIKVLRTTNFTNEGKLNLSKEVVVRDIVLKKYEKKKLKYGDVIIEKSGGSPTQPVGRVVYFDLNEDGYVCNNFTSVIRPNNSVDGKYLLYGMYHLHNTGRTLSYQNKTTGIINLKLENYLNGESLFVPDIEIQRRIIASLDASDTLIQKRKEAIAKLDELVLSVFLEMFGDPAVNPKQLKKEKLKNMGLIQTGNTPSREDIDNYGDFIEWIKSDNINTPFNYLTPAKEYLSEKGAIKGRIAPSGSILVTCIAGSRDCIGNVAITDRQVAFNQQINSITALEGIDENFLYVQFLVGKDLIQEHPPVA